MTNQAPVTLDDLKRAIDHYGWASKHAMTLSVLAARGDAWRTAFKWRNGWVQRYWDAEVSDDQKALELEEIEGLRLVEKL